MTSPFFVRQFLFSDLTLSLSIPSEPKMARSKRTTRRAVPSSSPTAIIAIVTDSCSPNPSATAAAKGGRGRRHEWDVEYARFFAVPMPSSSGGNPVPVVRSQPLQRSRRSKGTWLPCSVTACLAIALAPIPGGSVAHVLSLKLGEDLIEEHVLYNLMFSWPQVSCVPECPIRGSRAVFISFKDASDQIQKFAVRFSQSSLAEEFLQCVKECSKEMLRMPSGNGFMHDSSPSKDVPGKSDYMGKRKIESDEMSSEDPADIYRFEEGALQSAGYTNYAYSDTLEVEDNNRPLEPLMTCDNIDSLFAGFPSSYTDLLNNCSSNVTFGEIVPAGESSSGYQNVQGYQTRSVNPCPPVIVPKTEIEEADEDILTQISKDMNNDNFQAMLFRIEKLIGGLGAGPTVL